MARIPRVVLPGFPHHITQRGNRRQTVFFSQKDYQSYLDLVVEGCLAARTECWAYCFMPNHVHLILVPRTEDGLREPFASAHRQYTRMINFRHGWRGRLWQERFHSSPMHGPDRVRELTFMLDFSFRTHLSCLRDPTVNIGFFKIQDFY